MTEPSMNGSQSPGRLLASGLLAAATMLLILTSLPTAAAAEGPAPPELLGPVGPDRILEITPAWREAHDGYVPDEAAVKRIENAAARANGTLSIEVVFGSWCSDSREQVPRLIKVMEQTGKDAIPTTYVGVPKARQERGAIITRLKITAIPTIVVSKDGQEVGRIVETPRSSIEEDLAAILSGSGSTTGGHREGAGVADSATP